MSGELAATGATNGALATVCFGRLGFHSVAANSVKETARGSGVPPTLRPAPRSKSAIICLIGVMPAIGSLEKGKLKAIAPTSRPSMYTGEPDMPAKTPVFSAFAPLKRAMIAD